MVDSSHDEFINIIRIKKKQERKPFIRSEAVTMSRMIQLTKDKKAGTSAFMSVNETRPDRLRLKQDFQNYLQNFSTSSNKEVMNP